MNSANKDYPRKEVALGDAAPDSEYSNMNVRKQRRMKLTEQ